MHSPRTISIDNSDISASGLYYYLAVVHKYIRSLMIVHEYSQFNKGSATRMTQTTEQSINI